MPRWVKVFVIIGIVLALGFVITVIAGIEHGPGLHRPSDGPSSHTPPADHGS